MTPKEQALEHVLQHGASYGTNVDMVAAAIEGERERCAKIAEALDSGRGNEDEIARLIRDAKPR